MNAGKYNKRELGAMCGRLLAAKDAGDPRYVEFVMTAALRTGTHSRYIEQQIVKEADSFMQTGR